MEKNPNAKSCEEEDFSSSEADKTFYKNTILGNHFICGPKDLGKLRNTPSMNEFETLELGVYKCQGLETCQTRAYNFNTWFKDVYLDTWISYYEVNPIDQT